MTVRRGAHTLKGAIVRAAAPLGGVSNASLQLGSHQFMLSKVTNPNMPDMLRLDHAIELDTLCREAGGGTPIHDFYAFALASAEGPEVSWYEHMATMAREGGETIEAIATALSDGQISDRNLEDMLAEAFGLQAGLSNLIGQLMREARRREAEG